MKFQSLEESSGVSIFQEYIIGLNSLVEKNFIKLEYHYEYSLAFLLVCIYRPSNLFKIGVIIYSNIIILKLKYCSYDFFLPLALHLMTFNEFCFSVVVICQEETVSDRWGTASFPGAQRRIWHVVPIVTQAVPVTVVLTQPVSVRWAKKEWGLELFFLLSFNEEAELYWDVLFKKPFSW